MKGPNDQLEREPRNLMRLWVCVVVGLALWFAPTPAGLTPQGWHVFGIFATTILSFILRPLPMGACVLVGLLVLAATGELAPLEQTPLGNSVIVGSGGGDSSLRGTIQLDPPPFQERIKNSWKASLTGFADSTVWLVVAAFLISGGMIHSGLGRRLALMMITALGRTTLGLGYAIAGAELVLAPFIPSNTARGGGIMAPIVNSLAGALGSSPHDQPRRGGEYLVLCGAHLNLVTAAMFLTGMAANPLVSQIASDVGNVELGWGNWLLGSIVPGLVSLALLPLVLYAISRPSVESSIEARQRARDQLTELGGWTPRQVTMGLVLLAMLLLWASVPLQKSLLGFAIPTEMVAMGGVVALMLLGVLRYQQLIGNAAAWDTLLWLGGLVTMAGALKESGFVAWFAASVETQVGSTSGMVAMIILAVIYFYSMYCFSMLTGHIMALVGVFFTVAMAAGAPPLATIALLGYFSNLCGCTTHYSTGPVIVYFGLGYVSIRRWMAIGLIVSLLHLGVWLGVGLPWWWSLGWLGG